jgi:membrane-associated phospholipid phosphatase
VFPGADAPAILTAPRVVNTWVLDNLDISTGVFPSGHVAVAFASAFGLLATLRHRPTVWVPGFLIAMLVYIATIYGRYHYAVDGLISIVITFLAWRLASRRKYSHA